MAHRKLTLGLFTTAMLTSAIAITACSSEGTKPGESIEAAGSLGLQLQVAQGFSLSSVTYTIVGPGGYSRNGSVDVSTRVHSGTGSGA